MTTTVLCKARDLVWESSRSRPINGTPFYRVEFYDSSTREKWNKKPSEFLKEKRKNALAAIMVRREDGP